MGNGQRQIQLNNSEIPNIPVEDDRWKLHNLSTHHLLCSLLALSLIIACSNLSFTNCIPQREIIKCAFRFMSPLQPPLSPVAASFMCSIFDTSGLTQFCVCLQHQTAQYHSDPLPRHFCIFSNPSRLMWQGTIWQSRRVGLPKCHNFTAEGGGKALIRWKVVILYLLKPYSYSTLHSSHIKPLQYKSLWMLKV